MYLRISEIQQVWEKEDRSGRQAESRQSRKGAMFIAADIHSSLVGPCGGFIQIPSSSGQILTLSMNEATLRRFI